MEEHKHIDECYMWVPASEAAKYGRADGTGTPAGNATAANGAADLGTAGTPGDRHDGERPATPSDYTDHKAGDHTDTTPEDAAESAAALAEDYAVYAPSMIADAASAKDSAEKDPVTKDPEILVEIATEASGTGEAADVTALDKTEPYEGAPYEEALSGAVQAGEEKGSAVELLLDEATEASPEGVPEYAAGQNHGSEVQTSEDELHADIRSDAETHNGHNPAEDPDETEFVRVLICGKEEHTHRLTCYIDPGTEPEDPELAGDAAVELLPLYEETGAKDSYAYAAALAEFLKDDHEDTSYYQSEVEDDGAETEHGYTRYGAWTDDPYAEDWGALFAAYTAAHAGLNIHTANPDTSAEELYGGLYGEDDLSRSGNGQYSESGDNNFRGNGTSLPIGGLYEYFVPASEESPANELFDRDPYTWMQNLRKAGLFRDVENYIGGYETAAYDESIDAADSAEYTWFDVESGDAQETSYDWLAPDRSDADASETGDIYDSDWETADDADANAAPHVIPVIPGDLVFLDLDEDFDADHVGIVTRVNLNKYRITAVVGDIDSYVREQKYDIDDLQVLGYARLPETIEAYERSHAADSSDPADALTDADGDSAATQDKGDLTHLTEGEYYTGALTYAGTDYEIIVSMGEAAQIPAGTSLWAEEILPGSSAYEDYLARSAEALDQSEEAITFARFFDISLIGEDGTELEPAAPVEITITYDDVILPVDGIRTAVHFDETAGPEILAVAEASEPAEAGETSGSEGSAASEEPTASANTTASEELFAGEASAVVGIAGMSSDDADISGTGKAANLETADAGVDAVSGTSASRKAAARARRRIPADTDGAGSFTFKQNRFSVTGTIVYTVDFHYEINGRAYNFSMPGGGFVLFSDLVKVLGITDDAQAFVSDVRDMQFSDPELIWVGKTAVDTTIGSLKELHALKSTVSADLATDQMEEIDAFFVPAGEWVLISLQPFDTLETLTVSMENGSIWTIEVTDQAANGQWEVWFDGTLGQYAEPSPFYAGASNVRKTVANNGTITLPYVGQEGVTAPTQYEYVLNGWYDIRNKKLYKPGDTVKVTQDMVFYADWVPDSYSKGSSANTVSDTPDTSGFVKTELFDYNELINIDFTNVSVNVVPPNPVWSGNPNTHSETWTANKSFAFISWNFHGHPSNSIGFPGNLQEASTYRATTLTTGIYGSNKKYIDMLFDNSEQIGKTIVGQGNYLFRYNEDTKEYYYDSDLNAATYNQQDGRFYVYNAAEYILDGNNQPLTNYLPFNDYPGQAAKKQNTGSVNYWFGMKNTIDFYLPDDVGSANANQVKLKDGATRDMVFKFSGDDDVWVFVDGKLVLDLGGIHNRAGGTIDFSTGRVTTFFGTIEHKADGPTTDYESAALKSLKAGNHELTVLYLERGSSFSNCAIYFNLMPQLKSLEVSKRLTGLQEEDLKKYENELFTYEIRIKGQDDKEPHLYNTPENPKDREKAIYKKQDGTTELINIKDGQVTLKHGETVTITNLDRFDSLYIAEEKGLNMNQFEIPHAERNYHDQNGVEYEEEITLHANHSSVANVDDWETPAYTPNETEKVTFTNTLKERELEVKKIWTDASSKSHDGDIVSFTVQAATADGTKVDIEALKNADGTPKVFTLNKANSWKETIYQLPVMTPGNEAGSEISYEITELPVSGYKTTYASDAAGKCNIDVFKLWPEGNAYHSEKIYVKLQRNSDGKYYAGTNADGTPQFTESGNRYELGENYEYRFMDLPTGDTYTAVQVDDEDTHTNGITWYRRDILDWAITNTPETPGIIKVEKKWLDSEGRPLEDHPEEITFKVYQFSHAHEWGAWVDGTWTPDGWTVERAATETEEGLEYQVCKYDQTHRNERVIAKLAHTHDWVVTVVPPTCTEQGYTLHHCTKDETHDYTDTFVDALGHDWGEGAETIAAKCTTPGLKVYICGRDNTHTKNEVIDALGHDWSDWTITKQATTTTKGEKTRTCIRCHETETDEIDILRNVYPGTTIPLDTVLNWPTREDYPENSSTDPNQSTTITMNPTGIFKYGGDYYVIYKQVSKAANQFYDGPNNGKLNNEMVKLTGKIIRGTWPLSNGSVKAGDLYIANDGSAYVFTSNDTNNFNNPPESGQDSRWYCVYNPATNSAQASAASSARKAARKLSTTPAASGSNLTLQQLMQELGVKELGVKSAETGNLLTEYTGGASGDRKISTPKNDGNTSWMVEIEVPVKDESGNEYAYYVLETDPSSGWITSYTGQGNKGQENNAITITNKKEITRTETPATLTVKKKWFASDGSTDVSEKYADRTVKFDVYQVTSTTTQAQSSGETQQMLIAVYDKNRTVKYLSDDLGHLGSQSKYVALPVGAEVTAAFTPKDASMQVTANYLDRVTASGVTVERGNEGNVVTLKFTVDKTHNYAYLMNSNLSMSEFDVSITIGTTTVSDEEPYRTNLKLSRDNGWTWTKSDLPGTVTEGNTTIVYKYYIRETDNGGTDTVVSGLSEVPVAGGEIIVKNVERPAAPTPQTPKDPEPEIRKYVEKVSGEGSNDDYNLTLTVKSDAEVPSSKVDVLFVVDTTYSMNYKQLDGGQTTSWEGIQNAVNYLTTAFDASDVSVEYAMTRFWSYQSNYAPDTPYQDSEVVQAWTDSSETLKNALAGLQLDNATNYDAAFYTLRNSGILTRTDDRADTPKLVIFISDGYPNIYYDANGYDVADDHYVAGRYPDSENAAFARLAQVDGMNGFYALGVSNGVGEEVLNQLISYANAEHRGAFLCNDTQAIKNAFDTILDTYAGSNLKKVRIEDTLSDYAQPAGTGTSANAAMNIAVYDAEGRLVAKTENGTIAAPVTLVLEKTGRNGSDTSADRTLTAVYDSAAKQLKLLFPENYELENHWDYRVTMAIEPTVTAYEYYRTHGSYPDTGDQDTDVVAGTRVTSSELPGFKSNKSAKLYYNDKDPKSYPDPVIQTLLTGIQLVKVDGSTEQPLKDAKFTLYRKAEADDRKSAEKGGTGLTVREISIPAGTSTQTVDAVKVKKDQMTDADGHILFDKLIPGTYYLEETEAPINYTGIGTLTFTITAGDYDEKHRADWKLLIPTNGTYMGCTFTWDGTKQQYNLTVPNTKTYGYALPSTGGRGTGILKLLGSAMLLGAGLLLWRKKKPI